MTKLTAKLKCQYPVDAQGNPVPHKLPGDELAQYHGVLGHYHIQTNKTDPGPAFQWERVIDGAEKMIRNETAPVLSPRSRGAAPLSRHVR